MIPCTLALPVGFTGLLSLREEDVSTTLKESLLATAKHHQMPGKYRRLSWPASGSTQLTLASHNGTRIFQTGHLPGTYGPGTSRPIALLHHNHSTRSWHTGVAVWLDFSVGLCQIPSEGGGSTNLLVTPTIPTATMPKDWLNTGLMLCHVASPWSGRP